MTVSIWEHPESAWSVGDDGASFTLRFMADGTTNKLELLTEIAQPDSGIPSEIAGVPQRSIQAQVVDDQTDLWDIEVLYANSTSGGGFAPTEIGEERESFSTAPISVNVREALEHVASYAPPGQSAPDHGGLINVVDGVPQGVEVLRPQFTMRVEKILDDAVVNQPFRSALFTRTGAVNSDNFRGFAAGELRLMRADVSQRDAESWTGVYEFLASENLTDLTIDTIGGIVKGGHDYLWTEHEETVQDEGTDDARKVSKIIAAHVEKLYPDKTFSGVLGLDG